jgi:predicted dehydrogenase
MQNLKIGVIGSGGRGVIAAHAHNLGEGSRVVACCDINPATLEQNKETYGSGVFVTHDYQELLRQDLDAVFVTVPDFLHEEVVIATLRAGKATYLEKPLAISTEACDRVLRAALESKSRLYLGHNMRHMPFVRKMKDLIDAGAIGQVKTAWCRHFVGNGGDYYFKDWHAERKYSNGLLLQKGAHDIDVLHWLCGGYTQRVNAFGALMVYGNVPNRAPVKATPTKPDFDIHEGFHWPPATQTRLNAKIDVEDVSMMQMQLDNGVLASYQQCHFTPDYWRSYTIIGDEGRLENFGNGEDGTCIKVWSQRKWGYNAPDEVHMIGNTEGEHGGADPLIVAEFVRFAREGGPTQTSPLAARHSVAAGYAATYSLRNGGAAVDVAPIATDLADYFG